MSGNVIFTIGHSNLTMPDFLNLLTGDGIEVVVDVRSQPVSRFAPHFNRAPLAEALRTAGLRYAFMGDTLGGRPDNPAYYDPDGHVRYDLWAASQAFQAGIERVRAAASKYRLALLCAEADPAHCHRHLLIARVLRGLGWLPEAIIHIGPDGAHTSEAAVPRQAALFGGAEGWRSPQSVLHKVQRSTSSSD